MDSGESILPYLCSRYTPLHLPFELGYPTEGLVTVAITGTECIANRQMDRYIDGEAWFVLAVRSDGLRPSSLPLPLQNYRQLHFIIIWVKFHPNQPLPSILTHYAPLSCQPLVDLPLDLETCHEMFGDASYYRNRMYREQIERAHRLMQTYDLF